MPNKDSLPVSFFLASIALTTIIADWSGQRAWAQEATAAARPLDLSEQTIEATVEIGQPVPKDANKQTDWVADLQVSAFTSKTSDWGYWGQRSDSYSNWTNHSNRLIPVYTFNCAMTDYVGANSAYRDKKRIEEIYHRMPAQTLNAKADYADQTDIYRLQRDLIERDGKRRVILIIFDGTDWQTTWMAATYNTGRVAYKQGRGTGLSIQDYKGVQTDFSFVVTSPYDDGGEVDVNAQLRLPTSDEKFGGYCALLGGSTPWDRPSDFAYLCNRSRIVPHAVTDSSSSATSLMAGIKTFNGAINVDENAKQVAPIAHWLQAEKSWAVGAVTSVPISHATPASAYAQNVSREDFQDLTRDMIGLPSVANRRSPLSGLDVVIGCGWNQNASEEGGQGANFVPGNRYLTDADFQTVTTRQTNSYVPAVRTAGVAGHRVLRSAADEAIATGKRLLGFFGGPGGHLPFRTANGDFMPVEDVKGTEKYSRADVFENPELAEMAVAALDVLSQNENGMWLMIEAGDVDWANHANNIDNSIGAVLSGDLMVQTVFDWIESHGGWDDTAVIVTADHGHYFNVVRPEALLEPIK